MRAYGRILSTEPTGSGKVVIEVEKILVDRPIICGVIKYDPATYDLTVRGEVIKLAPLPKELVITFISNPNRVISLDEFSLILYRRTSVDYSTECCIRGMICVVRKKIPGIESVRGRGYILRETSV